MSGDFDLGNEEYATLRDEMLRADDQAITLTGFALVAASFLAAAVIEAASLLTKSLLLIGFNIIILTLVIKVREKRGQQGRIAAYIRVFHEHPSGWETRVHGMRANDDLDDDNPWGLGDPREHAGGAFERFHRRAALGEISAFLVLSFFALAALLVSVWTLPRSSLVDPEQGITPLGVGAIVVVVVQALVTGLVFRNSRTFKELGQNSLRWQRIWEETRAIEELRRRIAESGDIILINGGPASGKTSLSQRLAPMLGMQLLSKDIIKESLLDGWVADGYVIPHRPGQWTLALPGRDAAEASDEVLEWVDDEVTRAMIDVSGRSRPCMLDANVAERQATLFASLAPRLVEILLIVDPQTLVERYNARPTRHWVHVPRASGDSSAWGGSPSVRIDGAERIEVHADPADGTESEATLAGILAKLASHYGVRHPAASGVETRVAQKMRRSVPEPLTGA